MKGGKRDVQPAQSVVIINKPEDSEDAANVGDLVKIMLIYDVSRDGQGVLGHFENAECGRNCRNDNDCRHVLRIDLSDFCVVAIWIYAVEKPRNKRSGGEYAGHKQRKHADAGDVGSFI